MAHTVLAINDRSLKRQIADRVLRALPDWFGIEEALAEYVGQSQDMWLWAAYAEGTPVGFLSLRQHNPYTWEVFCMGILQNFHRQGIGSRLVAAAERYCGEHRAEFLTVKTLDASRPNAAYAKTRQFYLAQGFRPLEVFSTLWDGENPCLFMAKSLALPSRQHPQGGQPR